MRYVPRAVTALIIEALALSWCALRRYHDGRDARGDRPMRLGLARFGG